MFDWLGRFIGPTTESRVSNLEAWFASLSGRVNTMSVELDALKAAIAADAEMDAKFVAAVEAMVAKVSDLTANLNEISSQATIAPADVQAVADQLQAHVADMATHLPADSTGAA